MFSRHSGNLEGELTFNIKEMDYFLPSDVARLVLGYLKQNGYMKTYGCFLKECPHLIEYCRLLSAGRELQTTMMGLSLLLILDEWARLKQSGMTPSSACLTKSSEPVGLVKSPYKRQKSTSPHNNTSHVTSRCADPFNSCFKPTTSIRRRTSESIEHCNETSGLIDSDSDSILNVESEFLVNVTSLTDMTPLNCRGDNMSRRNLIGELSTTRGDDGNVTDTSVTRTIHKSPFQSAVAGQLCKLTTSNQKSTKSPHKVSHVHFVEDSDESVANAMTKTNERISILQLSTTEKENVYPTLKGLLNTGTSTSAGLLNTSIGSVTPVKASTPGVGQVEVMSNVSENLTTFDKNTHKKTVSILTNGGISDETRSQLHPVTDLVSSATNESCNTLSKDKTFVSNSVSNINKSNKQNTDKSKLGDALGNASKSVETSRGNSADQPQVETVDCRNKCLSWISSSNNSGNGDDGGCGGVGSGTDGESDKHSASVVSSVLGHQAEQLCSNGSTSQGSDSTDKTDAAGKKSNIKAHSRREIPEHKTPNKKLVSSTVCPNIITPVKLFQLSDANMSKSPRRKKPKTPKKRTSDVSPVSIQSTPSDDPLPIFRQILSDTRLHEKLAATCNILSGQFKLNHSGSEKEVAAKETKSKVEPTQSAEELEVVTASKSLEEILDMDTNFATDLMSENIDMSDPAFESLFKLFGTDKESFNENLRREKTTEEMTKEVEELEKSIHEMATYMNSPRDEYGSPHPEHLGSQDLFSSQPTAGQVFKSPQHRTTSLVPQHTQPCSSYGSTCGDAHIASFTPLLRENELGSSPLHSTPSICCNHNPTHPQSDNCAASPGSTATQPFSPAMSEYSQTYNPATPSSLMLSPRITQQYSPLNRSQQSENLYNNQEIPKTPKQAHQKMNQSNLSCTPMSSMSNTFVYSQEPSTPSQASTVDYNTTTQGFHQSTPVQPKNHQFACGRVPANCSPLVKGDLHARSPVMVQKNGLMTPQARKSIFPPSGINRQVFSPQHGQSLLQNNGNAKHQHQSTFVSHNIHEGNPPSPIMPSTTGEQQVVNLMTMVNDVLTQNGSSNNPGDERVMSMFTGMELSVSNNPCSTIENTIGCISLPEYKEDSVTVVQSGGKKKGKKGGNKVKPVLNSNTLSTFTTLKGILSKPPQPGQTMPATQSPEHQTLSMPDLAAHGTPEHAQITELDIHNQNICILSPGGSTSINIPLLGCHDAANDQIDAADTQTVNLWEQDLNSSVQYSILPENQVTQPIVNSIVLGNAVDVVNQMKNTEKNECSKNSKKNPKNGKRKYTRKKKDDNKSVYFKSPNNANTEKAEEPANNESEAIYTATPISTGIMAKAYVRHLNFGPQADMSQFKKIAPKPAVDPSQTVIIVNNSPAVEQNTNNHNMLGIHSNVDQGQSIPVSLICGEIQSNDNNVAGGVTSPASNSSDVLNSSAEKSTSSSCASEVYNVDNVHYSQAVISSAKMVDLKVQTKSKKYPLEAKVRPKRSFRQTGTPAETMVLGLPKKNNKVINDTDIGSVASIDLTSDVGTGGSAGLVVNTRQRRYPIRDMKNALKKITVKKTAQVKISDILKQVNGQDVRDEGTYKRNIKAMVDKKTNAAKIVLTNSKQKTDKIKFTKDETKRNSKVDKAKDPNQASVVVLKDSDDSAVMCVTSPVRKNTKKKNKLKVKLRCKKNTESNGDNKEKLKLTLNSNRNKMSYIKKNCSSDDEMPLSKVRLKIHENDSTDSKKEDDTSITIHENDTESKGEGHATKISDGDINSKVIENKVSSEINNEVNSVISVAVTPKKIVVDNLGEVFTPSKEIILGKVGLTPTKMIDKQTELLSPSRANPLDILAEWQNSPMSGKKGCRTPSIRNKFSEVDSPFKSPTTPKRRTPAKRLFGSPQPKNKPESHRIIRNSSREMRHKDLGGKINGVIIEENDIPAKQLFDTNKEKSDSKLVSDGSASNKKSIVVQNIHIATGSQQIEERVKNIEAKCNMAENDFANSIENENETNHSNIHTSLDINVNEAFRNFKPFEERTKKEKKKKHKDKKKSKKSCDKHDNESGSTNRAKEPVMSPKYPLEVNVTFKESISSDPHNPVAAETFNSVKENKIESTLEQISNDVGEKIHSDMSNEDSKHKENEEEDSFEENRQSVGNVPNEKLAKKSMPSIQLHTPDNYTSGETLEVVGTADQSLHEDPLYRNLSDTGTSLETSKHLSLDGSSNDHSHNRHHHHHHHHHRHGKKKKSKKRHREESGDDSEKKEKQESKRRKHKHKKSKRSLENLSSLAIEKALSQLHSSPSGSTNPTSLGSLSPVKTP